MNDPLDFDPDELVVEPSHPSEEEMEELRVWIADYRRKHPLSESQREAMNALVGRIRIQNDQTGNRE